MMTLAQLAEREQRRHNLVTLALACVFAVGLTLLATTGPSDAKVAGASTGEQVFIDHCHATPENLAWCEWLIFMEDPANRAWFVYATNPYAGWTVWDDLRLCEAPDWAGGWQANTGNGYYGGLQFSLTSWRGVGGSGYPHHHSRETQIQMGERLLAAQGWGAWPSCSRQLGLR